MMRVTVSWVSSDPVSALTTGLQTRVQAANEMGGSYESDGNPNSFAVVHPNDGPRIEAPWAGGFTEIFSDISYQSEYIAPDQFAGVTSPGDKFEEWRGSVDSMREKRANQICRGPRQLTMFRDLGLRTQDPRAHGGGLHVGKRKEMRPLDRGKPIHITMRATPARGRLSLRTARNFRFVEEVLRLKALKFGVRVQSHANVGNHLHLHVRMRSRKEFGKFLKSVTSLIARHVTGARRGKKFGKFWDTLTYTRVLSSRREELRLIKYIQLNKVEGEFGRIARGDFELDRKFGLFEPPRDPPGRDWP